MPPAKVAPPVTTKVTLTFGTLLPPASFTVALSALVALPLATAPLATLKSAAAMTAVVSSAIKAEFFGPVTLLPTAAVTECSPATRLTSAAVATPLLLVVAVRLVWVPPAKVAPPVTTKVTLTFGTALPLPSFTVALSALVLVLFATAPLATLKSVSVISAVVSSAIKVEFFGTVVLDPTVAVTG
ncbi:Uncharacterised protein [Yersinia frederiksenii]|nr:Uncharacterised protein [Yersinia frederiksenii]